MSKKLTKRFLATAAAFGLATSVFSADAAQAVADPSITPEYTPTASAFERVQSDAGWRSQYHYAPNFQPVENQCANVRHGDWARVNCWTDDGDNLIVRVEFLHPRVKPSMVRVKNDTAHTATGGQAIGKTKQYEIPASNRTAEGNPYIVFNYEYFEGQSFYIEAFGTTSQSQFAWSDFTVSVTQNVNRATDADPVVARQATVYDSNFYKLSQPLSFEKIIEVDGKPKAVYSMINANPAEADLVDKIEIWAVDPNNYTWRPEAQDGNWAAYVQTPVRGSGCDASNTDVPRLGYNGMGANYLTYTKDSADYPLIREGAKTSIIVDLEFGERFQYETWMNGCANPFGRPGQMRPYQGQLVTPEYSRMSVTKNLAGNYIEAVSDTQEFGGTVSYPAGVYTQTFANTSNWSGDDWTGTKAYEYGASNINWATTAGNTWLSPLLPANATVTVAEDAPAKTVAGDWTVEVPGTSEPLPAEKLVDIYHQVGTAKTATNTANSVDLKCLTPEHQAIATEATAEWKIGTDTNPVNNATVVNRLEIPTCPEPEPAPDPEPTPDPKPTPEPVPLTPEKPEPKPLTPEKTPLAKTGAGSSLEVAGLALLLTAAGATTVTAARRRK